MRPSAASKFYESRGRIYVATRADGDEQVAEFQRRKRLFHPQRHFAEPHDMGSQPCATFVARVINGEIAAQIGNRAAVFAVRFEKFTMRVDDVATSSALVQIVNVLGDDEHLAIEFILEFGEGTVRSIGLCVIVQQVASAVSRD